MDGRYLGINVKDAALSCCCDILYSLKTGAVKITGKLSVFDKCAFGDQALEVISCCKVILLPISFFRMWSTGGIFGDKGGYYGLDCERSRKEKWSYERH